MYRKTFCFTIAVTESTSAAALSHSKMLRCRVENETVSVFTFISNVFVFLFLEPSKTSRRTGPPVNQIRFEPLSKYSRFALNFKHFGDSLRKKKKKECAGASFGAVLLIQVRPIDPVKVSGDFHPTSERRDLLC